MTRKSPPERPQRPRRVYNEEPYELYEPQAVRRERRPVNWLGILLWPFRFIWSFVGFIFKLGGRLLSLVLGVALIILGVVITVLTFGTLSICGVPMAVFGGILIIRALF